MKKNFALILLVLLLVTCKKKKTVDQSAIDKDIITNYISSHQLNALATGTGLYYVIKTIGTGANPTANSNVTVVYKGYFTSSGIFDQSSSTGININLGSVIEGWKEGIPYFKKGGGKGILLIPSALGYGSQATSSIPANSVLIFDVELP